MTLLLLWSELSARTKDGLELEGVFRLSADGVAECPSWRRSSALAWPPWVPQTVAVRRARGILRTRSAGPNGRLREWVAAERPRGQAKAADPAASTPTAHARRRRLLRGRSDQEAVAPGALGRGGHCRVPRCQRSLPRRAHQDFPSRPAR